MPCNLQRITWCFSGLSLHFSLTDRFQFYTLLPGTSMLDRASFSCLFYHSSDLKKSFICALVVTSFDLEVKYRSFWSKNMRHQITNSKSCRKQKLCISVHQKYRKYMNLVVIVCFANLVVKNTNLNSAQPNYTQNKFLKKYIHFKIYNYTIPNKVQCFRMQAKIKTHIWKNVLFFN